MYRNLFRGTNSNNVGKKRFSGLEVTESLHIAKRGRLSSSKACLLFANDDLSEKRGILCKAAARAMLQVIGIPMLRSVARARASGRTRLALPSVM